MDKTEQFNQIREAMHSVIREFDLFTSHFGQSITPGEERQTAGNDQLLMALAAYLSLQPTLKEDDLLGTLLELTMQVTQAEGAGITLYDDRRERLIFVAAVGKGSDSLVGNEVPLEGSVTGLAFASGEIQVATPKYVKLEQDIGVDFRNLIVAPLLVDDEVIGTLGAVNKNGDEMFTPTDIQTFGYFATLAAVIVRQHRRESQILEWIEGKSAIPFEAVSDHELSIQEKHSLKLTMMLGRLLRMRPDLTMTVEQYLTGLTATAKYSQHS